MYMPLDQECEKSKPPDFVSDRELHALQHHKELEW